MKTNVNILYGDGIHDDTAAIQELLDSGVAEVHLPAPKAHYCISKTLKIHSCQTLRLAETATVRLLPGSSCAMVARNWKRMFMQCRIWAPHCP